MAREKTATHRVCSISISICLIAAAFILAATPAFCGEKLGKTHKDKNLGFSIRVPKNWEFVASTDSERYLTATFTTDKPLRTKKAKSWQELAQHYPLMRIIAFTPQNASIEESDAGEAKVFGKTVQYIKVQNPFRDFREYLKGTIKGYYLGEERKGKVKGVPCTFIDVYYHEHRPPLRRTACVYHLGDVDIVVFLEVMEEWYPRYESFCKKLFGSFKREKRETASAELLAGSSVSTREDFIKLKTENLPDGWSHEVTKRHLVISKANKKFTAKVVRFADAIRDRIEKDFLNKGSMHQLKRDRNKVELPVIRILDGCDAFKAVIDTSRGYHSYDSKTGDVVIFDGTRQGWTLDRLLSIMARGILIQFVAKEFDQVRPDEWYVSGMAFYYKNFKLRGSTCKFTMDPSYSVKLRDAVRNQSCSTFKTLMRPEGAGVSSTENYWKVGTLVCFLKSKKGNRKPWKNLLDHYLENFVGAYNSLNSAEEYDFYLESRDGGSTKGMLKEFKKQVKQRAFESTFGDWTDSDWEKLEKAWEDWAT